MGPFSDCVNSGMDQFSDCADSGAGRFLERVDSRNVPTLELNYTEGWSIFPEWSISGSGQFQRGSIRNAVTLQKDLKELWIDMLIESALYDPKRQPKQKGLKVLTPI